MKKITITVVLAFCLMSWSPDRDAYKSKTSGHTFAPDIYQELPLGSIKPEGWLLNQLQIMRDGSTGHLDEIHPKIARDNGWLGGNGDGWEETPYWLDGAVPLAYLLGDVALETKVLKYINWTLDHQRPSGYFGPVTKEEKQKGAQVSVDRCEGGEDWWPKMVMLKVLQQYYEATRDKRVIPFMTRYFNYQSAVLRMCPIGKWSEWATSRGADNEMIIQWLYKITHDDALLDLADRIETQCYPWSTWLGNRDWVMDAAANQTDKNWMRRHAVNVGMALKSPAINYQRSGTSEYLDHLKTGWSDLMLLHGLPMGIFSGDEDLHGNEPTQGVELCAIVESMYSLEKIISITGDLMYMDALEKMAFNALPTQTTDDYNQKQYFQMANQVQVSRGVFDFSLPFDRGMNNVFGLRSGYTCCTSNMHQGWTKFATHLWYGVPEGLAALEYSPNILTTTVNGKPVTIREVTDYPFDDRISFEFSLPEPVTMSLTLRIPGWCKEAVITLNGKPFSVEKGKSIVRINRPWSDQDKLILQMQMEVRTSQGAKHSTVVERGPLVYALKIGERWEKGNEPNEGDFSSIYPSSDWNYGLLQSEVNDATKMKVNILPLTAPFVWNQKHAPVSIEVSARKLPNWKLVDGVAHQPVTNRSNVYQGEVDKSVETVTLIPYGCTKLRIVAFPVVK